MRLRYARFWASWSRSRIWIASEGGSKYSGSTFGVAPPIPENWAPVLVGQFAPVDFKANLMIHAGQAEGKCEVERGPLIPYSGDLIAGGHEFANRFAVLESQLLRRVVSSLNVVPVNDHYLRGGICVNVGNKPAANFYDDFRSCHLFLLSRWCSGVFPEPSREYVPFPKNAIWPRSRSS